MPAYLQYPSQPSIHIHQIIAHDMQHLRERAQLPATNAIHQIRKVQQDPARALIAALVRHAIQRHGATIAHEMRHGARIRSARGAAVVIALRRAAPGRRVLPPFSPTTTAQRVIGEAQLAQLGPVDVDVGELNGGAIRVVAGLGYHEEVEAQDEGAAEDGDDAADADVVADAAALHEAMRLRGVHDGTAGAGRLRPRADALEGAGCGA